MFTHNIKYIDFNGTERQEDFHFHLSLPELTRIEAKIGRSLKEHVEDLNARKDVNQLVQFLEDVILTSYGQKTVDGRSFRKTPELRGEFEYSQAYAEFFEELLTNPELARKFGEKVADNGKAKRNQVAPTVVSE